jgi:hypothetical protein
MIDTALSIIKTDLNVFIKQKAGITTDMLTLSRIMEQNGELNIENLGLSLVRIEEDTTSKKLSTYQNSGDGNILRVNPEISLNLYVLFTANFGKSNYEDALKFLSYVVAFFQGKNVFNHENTMKLDPDIEKLIIELVTPSFEQQNHLWGTIGAKYLPSVMYKIRLVSIQDHKVAQSIKSVQTIDTRVTYQQK